MSRQYDEYLANHQANVRKAFTWIDENLNELIKDSSEFDWGVVYRHDFSKRTDVEYNAYDAYFYGEKTPEVEAEFNRAWLHHIHKNPHHWQHWVLINDDPESGTVCIEMPYHYIIEMICDWWSFSWSTGNLYSMFDWYEQRKGYIQLHPKTRENVEFILRIMKRKLDYMYVEEM